MKKNILITLAFLIYMSDSILSQNLKSFNSMTFYYIDNSEGAGAEPLNSNITAQLFEKLEKLKLRTDNYFVLLAANGENPKQKSDIEATAGSEFLNKYLSRSSKESDATIEKSMIRELFRDYPVRIKQTAEFNLYLSTQAIKQSIKDPASLSSALLLPKEILTMINADDIKVKINVYTNEINSDQYLLNEYMTNLMFCDEKLGIDKINYDIIIMQ